MSRRTKIIIIGILIVVAVLLIILLAWAPKPYGPGPQPTPTPATQPLVPGGLTAAPAATPVTKEPKTQSTLEAIARTFAERLGSFSTESGTANVEPLRSIMTERMAAAAQLVVQQSLPATGFYGVTTKVLSVQIVALNAEETEAQIVVQTQRTESRASGLLPVYQKLTASLVKDKDGWKVDQAVWQ